MNNKSVILINKSGLSTIFEKALTEEGFEVTSLCRKPFKYKKTFFKKVINVLYRNLLNDRLYLERDFQIQYNKELIRRAEKIRNNCNYALFFRADLFSEELIKVISKKVDKMMCYQYDGWEVCSKIKDYENYFDKIFFFDSDDLDKIGRKSFPLTNCWFEDLESKKDNILYDFFYIGVGTEDRKILINNLKDYIGDRYKIKAILTIPEYRVEMKGGKIEYCHKGLSYQENIDMVKQSKVIIDFKLSYHNGLSFRFFEALCYNKKIITNNKEVKKYDFYHPNNILVTDFTDFTELDSFMQLPYFEINEEIKQKYSFKNWIKYVLDITPHNTIHLPK